MNSKLSTLAAAAALFTGFTVFAGFSAPARADMVPLQTIAHWQISADAELCKARGEYQDGTSLIFYLNSKGAASVGIENLKWTALPRGSYEIVTQVDRTAPITNEGLGGPGWVNWQVPFNEATINLLSYGNMLYVQVGSQNYRYKLDRSEAVWKALAQCIAPRMAVANPFAAGPQASAPAAPPDANPFAETHSNPYRRM